MSRMIHDSDIPSAEGFKVADARRWYLSMSELVGGIHADDGYDRTGVNGRGEEVSLSIEAHDTANEIHRLFVAASGDWSDPDFLYDVAGQASFEVERHYPGIVVDVSIPAASRTGWRSLPGQALPTLVVEEGGKFIAVSLSRSTGLLSQAGPYRISETSGVRWGSEGEMHLGDAVVASEGTEVSYEGIEAEIENCAGFADPRAAGGPTP